MVEECEITKLLIQNTQNVQLKGNMFIFGSIVIEKSNKCVLEFNKFEKSFEIRVNQCHELSFCNNVVTQTKISFNDC